MVAGLCVLSVTLYLSFVKKNSDPCLTETVEVLTDRYPQLKKLKERHQEETARLLAMHRQQDVTVNLEMNSEQINPEEALKLSLLQINQLEDLRKRQNEEFNKLCHEVVAGTN